MPATAPREAMRIAVFARAPVAGRVKTRLAAMLGDEGAADLHARLARHAVATAVESGVGDVQLWCDPDESHPFFASCAAQRRVNLRPQSGIDLGERMRNAIRSSLDDGEPMVLIGSDCPALGAGVLRAAAEALASHDAVFAPAEDGGYVLVGLAKDAPRLFEGIEWGAASVMDETRARLGQSGLRWKELATLWDVDRPEDYARLEREGWLARMGA